MQTKDFRPFSLLLVDDNAFDRKLFSCILNVFHLGRVIEMSTVADGLKELQHAKIDCVLVDWAMKPDDGLELVRAVRGGHAKVDPKTPIILCSSYTELKRIIIARDTGVDEILAKPFSPAHLYNKLAAALFQQRDFVNLESYNGPDRRRHKDDWKGTERRGKRGLSQDQIDRVVHEDVSEQALG